MLDDFWSVYENNTFLSCFYECHLGINQTIIHAINTFSLLITVIGLSFILDGKGLHLWSVLILAMSVLTGLRDVWDISKKVWSLKYYLQESNVLLLSMGKDWRLIEQGKMFEEDILDKISFYEAEFHQIYEKYLGDLRLTEYKRTLKKADKKADDILAYKHKRKEETYAQSEQTFCQ